MRNRNPCARRGERFPSTSRGRAGFIFSPTLSCLFAYRFNLILTICFANFCVIKQRSEINTIEYRLASWRRGENLSFESLCYGWLDVEKRSCHSLQSPISLSCHDSSIVLRIEFFLCTFFVRKLSICASVPSVSGAKTSYKFVGRRAEMGLKEIEDYGKPSSIQFSSSNFFRAHARPRFRGWGLGCWS